MIHIQEIVENIGCKFLVDCGSNRSFVSEKFVKENNIKTNTTQRITYTIAVGSKINVNDKIRVLFKFEDLKDKKFDEEFNVLKGFTGEIFIRTKLFGKT